MPSTVFSTIQFLKSCLDKKTKHIICLLQTVSKPVHLGYSLEVRSQLQIRSFTKGEALINGGWPWTLDSPAITSQVLGLQVSSIMLGLCSPRLVQGLCACQASVWPSDLHPRLISMTLHPNNCLIVCGFSAPEPSMGFEGTSASLVFWMCLTFTLSLHLNQRK